MPAKRVMVAIPGLGGGSVPESDPLVEHCLSSGVIARAIRPRFAASDGVLERAKLAVQRIEEARRSTHGPVSFCVYGTSAGGVVARAVLALLKQKHSRALGRVRSVVSMDAPHEGAYIPAGCQYVIDWAWNHGWVKDKALKADIERRYRTRPARQLLAYYASMKDLRGRRDVKVQPRPHADRRKLLEFLSAWEKGGWCGDSVKIGIANGSRESKYPTHNVLTLEYRGPARLWFGGHLRIYAEGLDTFLPSRTILSADHTLPPGVKIGVPKATIRFEHEPVAWPMGPGAYDDSVNHKIPKAIGDSIKKEVRRSTKALPKCSRKPSQYRVAAHLCYVPTVSALGLRVKDPFWLRGRTVDAIRARSPFDEVILARNNTAHADWSGVGGPGRATRIIADAFASAEGS